jgi:hypothetical protein
MYLYSKKIQGRCQRLQVQKVKVVCTKPFSLMDVFVLLFLVIVLSDTDYPLWYLQNSSGISVILRLQGYNRIVILTA